MDDPVEFLRTALDAAAEAARLAAAVDPSPWYEDVSDGTYTRQREGLDSVGLVRAADNVGLWDRESSDALSMAGVTTTHIALHDPAAVLRRIAADRKQLELHAENPYDPGCCGTCTVNEKGWAAPVASEVPCATIRNLAEGWGWTPSA